MKVIVACEFSGRVRDSFRRLGHDAISCDLLPSECRGPHLQKDIRDVDLSIYDLMVAHPSCQHLAASGARWWAQKQQEQAAAIEFVQWLLSRPVPRIALENPIGCLPRHIGKATQIIHPWQFGHGETKATCLWLKGLPLLKPTNIVDEREPRVHHETPGVNRWKRRSRTYIGIAAAMAEQWGGAVLI